MVELLGQIPDISHWQDVARAMEPKGVDHSAQETGMFVVFFRPNAEEARLDVRESEIQGRPVYRDEVWIQVQAPGDNKNIRRGPAILASQGPKWPSDLEKYPQAWARFESGDVEQEGTPIERAGIMNGAQAATYRALGIFTLEQLAEVNDTALPQMGMGSSAMREKARKLVAPADQALVAIRAENAVLQDEVVAMRAQLEQILLQQQAQPQQAAPAPAPVHVTAEAPPTPVEPPRRPRGRPRKVRTAKTSR